MLDVDGTSLTSEDKELLGHPLVGGLILFARNYQSPEQVNELTRQIKASANGDILIAVDHEGGRVQRFREQFSAIPAMGQLWQMANGSLEEAKLLAKSAGQLVALEVMSVGVDISFAPVVDINDISEVIGDRAFHQKPEVVEPLAKAFIQGMHSIGMKCTAKHFPGHGSVKEDSHIAMPLDGRNKQEIFGIDMQPFKGLMQDNLVNAVMPAHVIYPDIDDKSVGFSPLWLQEILRGHLGFDGVIFSDDLTMEGAASIGGYIERSEAAQQAGCDMLLICNNRSAAVEVIDNANLIADPISQSRLQKMLPKTSINYSQLPQLAEWQQARTILGIS
ncbi:beta-N-acetylhexosaminidase [Thalassotalea sp. M1531]|uniref:Beta-hexosaminidase n=2 Tax=Thalassotalea algicola TaxID=2716224 RepID=A0A7Y0LFF8_9GAMM|nr:beta-N-acetylhexosaminidase [Thalassotalea algicola]